MSCSKGGYWRKEEEEFQREDCEAGLQLELHEERPPEECLDGVEVVINLLGENISSKRWSTKQKEIILESTQLKLDNSLLSTLGKFGSQQSKSSVMSNSVGFPIDCKNRSEKEL